MAVLRCYPPLTHVLNRMRRLLLDIDDTAVVGSEVRRRCWWTAQSLKIATAELGSMFNQTSRGRHSMGAALEIYTDVSFVGVRWGLRDQTLIGHAGIQQSLKLDDNERGRKTA